MKRKLVIVIGVVVGCCVLLAYLMFVLPVLLGPQIGNIFSRITSGLGGT